ncbi:hypothetical protein Vadar_005021 [Vaccinium darrowii]|uniref:Uncharacterized protein n=1 Tax=Vaccinium darrowii TaxID=229202 RepID=A0ACB7XXP1_9ERIC|nr:hypothetical protein Vadar_005021 [Vaccinium darrowii]
MASLKSLTLCLALLILFFTLSCEAREFMVAGRENSWRVPPSPDDLNKWSRKMRFVVGDTLVLQYDPKTDSVLQVTEEDYIICNTSKPIKAYNDGNTKIPLDRSGPFYFISGTEGNCEKGQKVVVTVLSPKHGHAHPPVASPSLAPAPSPAEGGFLPLAPVPTAGGYGLMGGGGAVCVAVVLSLVGLSLVM